MDALVNELMKELNCDTVFTIPVLGGIPVKESVVVTWIIMAVILVLCIALTRNLSVENPGRGQIILETIVSGGHNFFKDTLGEHGAEYIPYLMTVTLYIGIANLIGLLGFKPPTKDMNVTAALAFMSIVLIEAAGIRQKGAKGWVKSLRNQFRLSCRSILWRFLLNHYLCACDFLVTYLVLSLSWNY